MPISKEKSTTLLIYRPQPLGSSDIEMSVDMAVKVLDESLGRVVLIKLKGGKMIRGTLLGFDQHMNLLLEQSQELHEENKTNDLGTIVVRGDNVVIISPPPPQ